MSELRAQGSQAEHHWRRTLSVGQVIVLGRAAGDYAVPWERWLSRSHAELTWDGNRLVVCRHPDARNPVFFRGEEVDRFEVHPGDCFAVGETTFTLLAEANVGSSDDRPLVQERAVNPQELKAIPFRDAPHRLDVLSRLPKVITSAADDDDLSLQLVNLLLAGLPHADVIAVVSLEAGVVTPLHWEARRFAGAAFQPSRRLVQEAVARQQRTVLHVWAATVEGAGSEAADRSFTLQGDLDWAFCTPVRGEAGSGWGLYVAGRFPGDQATTVTAPLTENDLADDLKFAELTADILGSLRQVRKLQQDQARLSRFFSPKVQKVLATANAEEVLQPREAEVTVMFCDLRGFSRAVEAEAGHLLRILQRVGQALGVMTQNILSHQGVVADFLGDAALGFWGWPLGDPEMTRQACLAALGIRRHYATRARQPDHPLADFQVGVGVATGRAVAGRIGPAEQAKVTVFGPVVNLASRLESMTKQLHVPILLDEATAQHVRERLGPGEARTRRLARVRPYGLETPLTVSELLPPAEQDPILSDVDLVNHEQAFDAFVAGDWDRAFDLLHRIPPRDRGKDTLIGFIIANNRTPPPGWDGVIPLSLK